MQPRPPPQSRSSRSTRACWPRPTCSPRARRSGSWSRSASTSATAPRFTPERKDLTLMSTAAVRSTAASTDREPNRWAVLALLSVAQLMVVLDATIVTIAIPSAQNALHFSTDSRQWIITAYALAVGSLLLLGGKLSDLFGRKWTLIAGLVGFSIASAIGGLAQSFGVLVAARTLQGA